jgi:hypothetical protein
MTDNANPSDSVEFRAPNLARRGPTSVWPQRAKMLLPILRSRPNEWAVFRDKMSASYSSKTAANYRNNFPEFEWLNAREPDGTYAVYVRFVPPAD